MRISKKKIFPIFSIIMLLVNIITVMPITSMKVHADSVPSNLLLWYKFDSATEGNSTTGSTINTGNTITDYSGNNYNGTLMGGATLSSGIGGGSVNLNGTDGYVKIPNGILNGQDEITISFFAKVGKATTNSWFFGLGPSDQKYIIVNSQSSGNVVRGLISTNSWHSEQSVEGPSTLPLNTWKHVTLEISGNTNTERMYIDGVQVAQNTNLTVKPSDVYDSTKDYSGYIGKSLYSGDPWFTGQISDFRIYNRILSADEVKQIAVQITDVPAINVDTTVGTAPNLPATVKATCNDGTTKDVNVTWDSIQASSYAQAGTFDVAGTIEGTSVKAKANVTVSAADAQVTSIAAINVNTSAGTAPKLPSTVKATYSDGLTKDISVTWEAIQPSSYAQSGTFEVAGTVQGTTIKAKAVVTVKQAESGMLLWYKFNSVSGNSITDESGNNNNGTLEDGATLANSIGEGSVKLDGSSAYVKIPKGILNGLNNITISGLVKKNGSGTNQWVFGLGPDSNKYIFLNSKSGGSKFRGAITVTSWNDEKAVEASPDLPSGVWKSFQLVISGDTHTEYLYVDGVQVATNSDVSLKPSDVYDATKDFSGYIGKSLYSGDPFFNGEVADFRIYNKALSADEIKAVNDNAQSQIAAANSAIDISKATSDRDKLSLGDTSAVVSNLTLPTSGISGSTISWSSNNTSVVEESGTVHRPAQGQSDATAVLTATIKNGTATFTKDFTVKVLAYNDANDVAVDEKDLSLGLTTVATTDLTLPSVGKAGSSISWKSSDEAIMESNGTIHRPAVGQGNAAVTLTATIAKGTEYKTKEFTLQVMEQYVGYVMSYFLNNYSGGPNEDGLNLAYSYDGLHWKALNNNIPVMKATIGTQHIRDPFILRKEDGKFVVMATNNWSSPDMFVWDSDDLLSYNNQRLVRMNSTDAHTWAPECRYDQSLGKYVVFWSASVPYCNTTTDFINVSSEQKFFDPGYTCIDGDIVKDKDNYYLFYKDERDKDENGDVAKSLKVAKSTSLNPGSFTQMTPNSYIVDSYTEGPACIKSLTENRWYLYYDFYGQGGVWGCSTTTNLEDPTSWTKLDTTQYSLPAGVRHGNAVGVTKTEMDALIAKWDPSAVDPKQAPAAPTELTATAVGSDTINLSWTRVTGATGYNVYSSKTADGTYTKVNSEPITTTTFSSVGLNPDTIYYYKVTALNTTLESAMSDGVIATTAKDTSSANNFTVKSNFNLDKLESGKLLDVQTNVTNNNSSQQSVLVIVALYDGTEKMVNMSYISKIIGVGCTDNLSAGFMLPQDTINYKVKVFVWDGDSITASSMQPLSNMVTLQ